MTAKTAAAALSLSSNPSRAEEKAFLDAVVAALPQNSYLANLLKPALVEWFAWQMTQDLCCDVLDAYEHAIKCLGEAAGAINEQAREIASLKAMIGNVQEEMRQRLADKERALENFRQMLEQAEGDIERIKGARDSWLERAGVLEAKTEAQAAQITALKVELFDLYRTTGRI